MHVLRFYPAKAAGGLGFALANQGFNVLHQRAVFLAQLLVLKKFHHLGVLLGAWLATPMSMLLGKVEGKIREAPGIIVKHRYISRRLVSHVHVVALVHEAQQRAAHRNHVVVGVGREDERRFEGRHRPLGPLRVSLELGLPPGQPVMVRWIALKILRLRL